MIKPVLQDDAFLDDLDAVRTDPDGLYVWWLGQSGYVVQHARHRVVIDPYLSDSLTRKYAGTDKPHVRISARVVDPGELTGVTAVTASHAHTDHLDPDTLRPIRAANAGADPFDPFFVAPRAIAALARERYGGDVDWPMTDGRTEQFDKLRITAVPAAHDRLGCDAAGDHLYLGYVVRLGRWSVYHSGDTVVYDGMADRVRREGPIDVAILPINGKVGNMGGRDAANLAKAIGARLVIPCHYDMFEFNTADPYAEFVPECERIGQPYRVLKLGERFSSSEIPRP